jgi:hypothetical protein
MPETLRRYALIDAPSILQEGPKDAGQVCDSIDGYPLTAVAGDAPGHTSMVLTCARFGSAPNCWPISIRSSACDF